MSNSLRLLPKIRDGLSTVYLEYGALEKDDSSVVFSNKLGTLEIPAAAMAAVLLGPGTTVTHAAMGVLAQSGCSVIWVGDQGTRFYASGTGETRKAARLLKQAAFWSHPEARLMVVRRMYERRFPETIPKRLTLEQLRGREGVRVRDAYARASRETGVKWEGRNYDRGDWESADPVNRALSTANACLHGLCHSAVVAAGYSPGIGFIHTGKLLSFVYDIADLYKAEITVPLAFQAARENVAARDREVRTRCRAAFQESKVLSRVLPDIEWILDIPKDDLSSLFDLDQALPGWLWNEEGLVPGGVNYGGDDIRTSPDETSGRTEALDARAQDGDIRGDDEWNCP